MSFISYAQNFEDVMLWRALQHIKNGFYIDVGANDPIFDSVTKAFYDFGWSGINIEPLEKHWSDLQQSRVRDVNLQCAAGAEIGEVELWECDIRGWATVSKEVVDTHSSNGYEGQYKKVPVRTLSSICEEFVCGDIHFLKIDVEGFEKAVIEGMDFTRFRPWIMVVESTKPNSKEEVYVEWEYILLNNSYSFAYSDGINRFYVANEHSNLLHFLRYPPNVFDNFIRAEQFQAEVKAQQVEVKAQQAEVKAQQAEVKAQQAEVKAQQAEVKAQQAEVKALQIESKLNENAIVLQSIYQSNSWKITAPMRWMMSLIVFLKKNGIRMTFKQVLHKLLRISLSKMRKHPVILDFVKNIITILGMRDRLLNLVQQEKKYIVLKPVQEISFKSEEGTKADWSKINSVIGGLKSGKILVVRGDINSYSGYAKACRLYKKSLSHDYDVIIGVDIHSHPKTNFNTWDAAQIDSKYLPVLCGSKNYKVDILTISSPNDFVVYEGAKNIGLFFWETDKLANQEWIERINKLDELWIPVHFMMDFLEEEGVKVKISFKPFPLNKEIILERQKVTTCPKDVYKLNSRGMSVEKIPYEKIPSEKIKILTVNTFIGRKGYPVLFSELTQVDRANEICLIVKVSSIDVGDSGDYLVNQLKQMSDLMDIKVDIYVVPDRISEDAMSYIENDCDVFVTCSYGEGFGLGVFEMYYAGKPVICGRNSAFLEYMPEGYDYFMECDINNYGLVDLLGVYPISAKWGVPKPGEFNRVLNKIIDKF